MLWRVDREGPLLFTVILDPQELVPEAREDNNRAELAFTASSGAPNLTVSHSDVTFDPDPAAEGQPAARPLNGRSSSSSHT